LAATIKAYSGSSPFPGVVVFWTNLTSFAKTWRSQRPSRSHRTSSDAQQRVEIATLATLPEAIARAGIRAPAVIVIGETVNLRSALDWLKCAYQ